MPAAYLNPAQNSQRNSIAATLMNIAQPQPQTNVPQLPQAPMQQMGMPQQPPQGAPVGGGMPPAAMPLSPGVPPQPPMQGMAQPGAQAMGAMGAAPQMGAPQQPQMPQQQPMPQGY